MNNDNLVRTEVNHVPIGELVKLPTGEAVIKVQQKRHNRIVSDFLNKTKLLNLIELLDRA